MFLAVTFVVTVTACSPPSDPGNTLGQDTSESQGIIARGPVATDAELAGSETAKRIRQNGLRIGVSGNTPLLAQQNPISGLYEGFDATLAYLLSKYLAAPNLTFHKIDTKTRESLVKEGTVDAVLNTYSITEERAKTITFAGPYLVTGQGFAVRRNDTSINSSNDFAGKRFLVSANSTGEKLAKELIDTRFPTAKLVPFSNATELIAALERGDGDVAFNDRTIQLSQAYLNTKIRVLDERMRDDWYGIAIKHCDVAFRDVINGFLVKLYESGLWLEVWKMTLGQVEPDLTLKEKGPLWPSIATAPGSRDQDITTICGVSPAPVS
ncbi:transporter substrate-binding domain-containing protein [Amycolatopsis magusensis]|uniref:transporter substrate-binding domain-containing protein n=1 Tax=Amycolatopsis magusensis TaxID=882444 RepID=UPI0037B9F390